MIDHLYPYLIVSGLGMLMTVSYLLLLARRQRKLCEVLMHLNDSSTFDLLLFLSESWPTLNKGGFLGMHADLLWFGTKIDSHYGHCKGTETKKQLVAGEIEVNITLFSHKSTLEKKFLGQILSDTFFNLVLMDIWIKVGSVKTAFEKRERKSIQLRHEINNLLQIINLYLHAAQITKDNNNEQIMKMMETSLPAIQEKVTRIDKAIFDDSGSLLPERLNVHTELELAIRQHGIDATLRGDNLVAIMPSDTFRQIIDNILYYFRTQDYNDAISENSLKISIKDVYADAMVCINFESEMPSFQEFASARVFEPLWEPANLAHSIGLYQCRRLAQLWRGSLTSETHGHRLILTLDIPKA
jgi:hypothetical protein